MCPYRQGYYEEKGEVQILYNHGTYLCGLLVELEVVMHDHSFRICVTALDTSVVLFWRLFVFFYPSHHTWDRWSNCLWCYSLCFIRAYGVYFSGIFHRHCSKKSTTDQSLLAKSVVHTSYRYISCFPFIIIIMPSSYIWTHSSGVRAVGS